MSKPIIVLVPGSWHMPVHYDGIRKELEDAGYDFVGVKLPTATTSHTGDRRTDIEHDITAVRQTVLQQLDSGKDVLVITHSYSSLPGAALTGFGKSHRQKAGKSNGVVGMIMMAGVFVKAGVSMTEFLTGKDGQTPSHYLVDDDGTTLPFSGPGVTHLMYNDLEPLQIENAIWNLKPQSFGVLTSVALDQVAGLNGIPLCYLHTTKDNVLSMEVQTAFVDAFRAGGLEVSTGFAPTGHCPFLKLPRETALFIRKIAGEVGLETVFAQKVLR